MDRKHFLVGLGGLGAASFFGMRAAGHGGGATPAADAQGGPKPKSEWKKILPPAAYAVLFEEDTERPGSSPLNDEHRAGIFVCAACYQPLFDSKAKFDSGTGWPSFFEPLPHRLGIKTDYKLVYPRTEYHCNHCGGHQGHVFDDGPAPTGKRYCNNGVALRFVPAGETLPQLRA